MSSGRLIPLAFGGPAENMAVDQMLLETSSGESPLLRLYQWHQPTLSLGYFQPLQQRREHPESCEIACVRRATGGGAIVHHHELTYSVVLPDLAAGPALQLYREIHQSWIETLASFGVTAQPFRDLAPAEKISTARQSGAANDSFLCFQRRTDEDLIVSGFKVMGSAQRKSRGRVLQHGSLLLRCSPHAPQLPGLFELASLSVEAGVIAEAFQRNLARRWQLDWQPHPLEKDELRHADQIREQKFDHPRWLQRR